MERDITESKVGRISARVAQDFCPATEEESSGAGRWPHFIIIGAAKSGTTTLYQYLIRHPDIYMPSLKEPEYFSMSQLIERKQWYHSLFREAGPAQVRGEASTDYTRWPHTPDVALRLHKWIPDIRLIYIMRHPVERAYSHYAHDMRKGVFMSFEEAMEATNLYVDSSMYMMQIERYLAHFARESFLFLTTDELRCDPGAVMNKMQGFLGLEVRPLVDGAPLKLNEGGVQKNADHFVRFRVRALLRKVGVLNLADRTPPALRRPIFRLFRGSPVGEQIASNYNLPMMRPETRARLLQKFEGPNRELASFLGEDLSSWNQ